MNTDDIALVCCYFNPCNYVSKYFNFLNFYREIIDTKNLHLHVVECIHNKSRFKISDNLNVNTKVYCNEIYWQKEQLLNLGINKLKNDFKYVGWIDGDIHITNPFWIKRIIESLEDNKITQICKKILKETNFKQEYKETHSVANFLQTTDDVQKLLHDRIGEPGYGYVYHSELFHNKSMPLYDKAICGSGDFLNLVGYLDIKDIDNFLEHDRFFNGLEYVKQDFIDWRCKNELVKNIGCSNNQIKITYHGSVKNRKYITRESILKKAKYNPSVDIIYNKKTQMYNITKGTLRKSISAYFRSRREDDFFASSMNLSHFKKRVYSLIKHYDQNFNTNEDPFSFLKKIKTGLKPSTPKKLKNQTDFVCIKNYKDVKFNEISKDVIVVNNLEEDIKKSYIEQYLRYIINNYDNLPTTLCLINEEFPKSWKFLNKQISFHNKQKQPKCTIASEYEIDIELSKNLHVKIDEEIERSRYNFKQWHSIFLGTFPYRVQPVNDYIKLIDINKNLYVTKSCDNNFIVSGESILKNKKEFYEKIYHTITKRNNEEEFLYFRMIFPRIFK